jgi:uncharacterized protein (DUF2147 family)
MASLAGLCAATWLLTGILPASGAAAADPLPTGEWRVADGRANIRIINCDDVLWGVISWEKEPGVDSENPDPARRNRPTLGLPILRAMKPTRPGLWEGEVYNADNGKTYTSRISLVAADVLRIEGCLLGFLCGGENWTRVKDSVAPRPAPPRPGKKDALPEAACAEIEK